MSTMVQKRVHNPVRVRSHAGEYKETVRGKEVFVPGFDGLVMERAEARDFLSIPSPRTDTYGNITPKALTFECEYCGTQFPPRLHPCFVNQVESMGILAQPEECNLCGKAIHEQGGMDRHITRDHKGVKVKGDKGKDTPSDDVLALKSELADMKLLLAKLLANKGGNVDPKNVDSGPPVVLASGDATLAEVQSPEAQTVSVPRSIRELGERFLSKRDDT